MCSYHIVYSQCSPNDFQPQVIYTDSTVAASLIIEDAMIDNLADVSQGVCNVKLNFSHDNVRELIIRLVSPGGQSIDLVGPINPTSQQTDNSEWDIEFVPCGEVPIPDPSFSSTYTNEDAWFSFGLGPAYTGSYNPNVGCLEDFNVGPVNGLWSLEIFSDSKFYEGELISFEIEFCDNNFICAQCIAEPGDFTSLNLANDYCQGNDDLLFDLSSIIPTLLDYNYQFYIIQDDEILDTQVNPDLRTYGIGEYQICGLSYFDRQSSALPGTTTYSELNDLFNSAQSPLCAKFTEECFTVNILPFSDTLSIDTTICIGDVFSFNNKDYNIAGQFRDKLGQDACDTLILIDLEMVELQALISNDSDLITCENDEIELSVGSSMLTSNTIVEWKTEDGNIQGNPSTANVIATQQGKYWLVLSEGGCSDSFFVDIAIDNAVPTLSMMTPDTLDCMTTTVDVIPVSSLAATAFSWTGPGGFTSIDENIKVEFPGIYTVEVTLPTGCKSQISEEVFANYSEPEFNLTASNISCTNNLGLVEISDMNPDYVFDFPGGALNTTTGIVEYQNSGEYTITATSLLNGCDKDTLITISSDVQIPDLTFEPVENIDCDNLSVNVIVNSNIPIASYGWVGPDGPITESGNIISVTRGGIYESIVVAENGCSTSKEQEVFSLNTDLPSITISAAELTCSTTSTQINVQVNRTDLNYNWYNNDGFSSAERNPIITEPGIYYLEAGVSSDCVVVDSIEILENITVPIVQTSAKPISCSDVSSQLTINDLDETINYQWSDSDGNVIMGSQPMVTESGIYDLSITGDNGCTGMISQEVSIDTISPVAIASAPEPLLCSRNQVDLAGDGSSLGPDFTYSWSTVDGSIISSANTITPRVGAPGVYNLEVRNQINGCIASTSVQLEESITDLIDFTFEKFDPPCVSSPTGRIIVGQINGGVGPYTYSIDGFSYQSEITFDELLPQAYNLKVKDSFGCEISQNVILQGGLEISVALEDSYSINLGDELDLSSEINTNGDVLRSINWTLLNETFGTGQERVTVRPLTSGIVELAISTDSGCTSSTTAFIEVTKDKDVYIPNAINPSSFGENSVFKVYASNAIEEIRSINVFDRWGNKVYATGSYDPRVESKEWDGTHNSQNLIPGIYVYLVEVLLIDGEERKISGDVLLVR